MTYTDKGKERFALLIKFFLLGHRNCFPHITQINSGSRHLHLFYVECYFTISENKMRILYNPVSSAAASRASGDYL